MKRCPECRRDYFDDSLSFCLDDGAALLDGPAIGEPATVLMNSAVSGAATAVSEAGRTGASTETGYENSIAVLPFAHLSSDPDDEYFCDGLAEELINALGRLDHVKVAGRTSAFTFKGTKLDVSEIARKLGVDHIVEGSVRKFGERMRINVQLISAADGFQVWSEKYDTDLRDLFDVQDEITLSVVKALRSKFGGSGSGSQPSTGALIEELRHHASSVEAYQLYLRGRFHFNKLTPDGFYLALDCFQKALEIDPNFAAAYAGIADSHIFSAELGPVPPREAMPKAKEAALHAIRLDPTNAEAHTSLAFILQEFEYDFEGSEQEYREAIELNPNGSVAHQFYGALLAQMGRHDEAERLFKKANELDPLSPSSNWVYPLGLFFVRKYDESLERTARLLELDPNFPAAHLVASFAYQMKGDHAKCVDAYTRFIELCGLGELAKIGRQAFESGGWTSFLRYMTSPETRPLVSSYITAVFYEALGEHASALKMLDASYDRREGHMVMLMVDPRFESSHGDPRFQAILSKVGFPGHRGKQ